jgi:alpha-galactosidase/6-phospho-beta-glucosidase family protein
MNPFDFINAINFTKKNLIVDEETEKAYQPFLVNRTLSHFRDTVLYANEMNLNHHLDSTLQNQFYINIIRKKKRFSKWVKPSEVESLEVIKENYGYSNEKAKSALSILNDEQIKTIMNSLNKGGKHGK